jgi:hypothetical protein
MFGGVATVATVATAASMSLLYGCCFMVAMKVFVHDKAFVGSFQGDLKGLSIRRLGYEKVMIGRYGKMGRKWEW